MRRFPLQEIFWRCTAHVVVRICVGAPLPPLVQVSRERYAVPIGESAWRQLHEELDLGRAEIQAAFREALRKSLNHPGPSEPTEPLPAVALGLLLMTLHLSQLDPSGRDAFSTQFREFRVAARRHLFGRSPAVADERDLRGRLFELAGVSLGHPETMFELPYRAYFLPLRSSVGTEWFCSPATAPESLPRDLLTRAVNKHIAVEAFEPSREVGVDLRQRLDLLEQENQALRGADASQSLSALLDPVLRVAGDPLAHLKTEVATGSGLAVEIAVGFTRVLQAGELQLFGAIGTTVHLKLPHPEYELEIAAPRERWHKGPGCYKVTRRGVRLRGAVFLRARVLQVTL